MKTAALKLLATSLLLGAVSAQAQFSINPLTSFGGGDGWLAPGEGGYAYLTAATTERGMAFGNGHLYLASRANVGGSAINVRILDALTGTDLGALNMGSGIVTGGTFPISMVSVGGDGAIYVANLASPVSATAPFKVYRWANESATPTLAYSSTTVTLGRLGDTFDAIGSGTSTRLVAGESNSSGSGTRNGYVVLGTSDGLNFTDSLVTFASTPPNAGDFRLGVTFTDSSHVIGTAGTTLRYTSYSDTTGTLLSSANLATTAERPMDYTVIDGLPLLATISSSDSRMRVYDATDPANLILLGTTTATSSTANSSSPGAVAWGDVVQNPDGTTSAYLIGLNPANGLQAFTVTIPEPSALALGVLGFGVLAVLRRIRK